MTRHRIYLFPNGSIVRVWGDAKNIGLGASWWRWSDDPKWKVIEGSPHDKENHPDSENANRIHPQPNESPQEDQGHP